MSRTRRVPAALVGCLLLAACGGSSGGGGDGIVPSGDRPAGDPSFVTGTRNTGTLTSVGFQGDGTLRDGESTVTLATGVVTGALAGQLNAARDRIDLADGGTVVLTNPADTEYVRLFAATPGTGVPFFGVVGFPSAPADMPSSGRVSYSGQAVLTAVDATRRYDLTGSSFIVADFGSGRVRIELNDLGGTSQGIGGGNIGIATIAGTGQIVIDDSRISGTTFAGGSPSVSRLPFTFTAQADASGTRGAFFGTGADEVAGRVGIADPQGDVGVLGAFIAE